MWKLTKISLWLIAGLVMIQMIVLVETRIRAATLTDFLAPYGEIMPGQSMELFAPPLCPTYDEYHTANDSGSLIRICHLEPHGEVVVAASVYVRDHIVQQLMFRLTNLYLGELALRWGRPIIQWHSGLYYAHWQLTNYVIETPMNDNLIMYWSPVNYLTVEGNSPQQMMSTTPVWSDESSK